MREIGEVDWAADEIYWASQVEADPVEVPPCDIGELIKDRESHIRMGLCGKSIRQAETRESNQPIEGSEDTSQSLISIFNTSNYPPPWPLIPFSAPTPKLEKQIPFHLLPRKLVVHDPWNLLRVDQKDIKEKDNDDMEWTSKDDVVRTYHLQLSKMGNEKVEKEKKLRAELVAKCQDIGQREGIPHMANAETSESPTIMVFPPLCPPLPESVPEAHLYLSPAHRVGIGNHSILYNAEWELPRSMLVKDTLCQLCIQDKVAEDLKERKKHGGYHYDGIMKKEKAGDGSQWILAESSSSTATLETKFPKETIADTHVGGIRAKFIYPQDFESGRKGKDEKGPATLTIKTAQTTRTRTYKGPVMNVFPEVDWQNPERGPHCRHIQESLRCEKVPPTAKVSVVAKLSKQYDKHLDYEAKNYQSFPTHLFEHWNGYNVIPPLHDPVPVGAVVPQFYGYYVPETNKEEEYLSPILLLENCGVPIKAKALNKDDKHECASLLFRLHEAGWNHC